jgi:murein DD-endopeptidase MepM/ murein hydrolase activator NlpD
VPKRVWIVFAIVTTLLASGGAGASTGGRPSGATALAWGIHVVAPGQAGGATATITSPPDDQAQLAGSFSCCGGAVSTGSITGFVSATTGDAASANATMQVAGISLFGGEVTASVSVKARATARPGSASGDFPELSAVVNGAAGGANQQISLGDWGYATTLEEGVSNSTTPTPGYRASVTALDIHLNVDHGGLPAGTEIQVGHVELSTQAGIQAPPPTAAPGTTTAPKTKAPEPRDNGVPPTYKLPPDVHPKLAPGGYVFPIYGPSSFVDTYGSPRADVAWHHGDDIFAPLGAPVLAVATGTVFSVGWNTIGGNRLWLRDQSGNEFYYAHLSAYTPLAVNGAQVQAGDVLGFVGNTGDAQGTPFHLHFEIHPVGLLSLGYDGVVNPTPYLLAWEHLQDVRFDAAAGWAPPGAHSTAPPPGAILLQVSDISSANGLDPASLRRAMAPASSEGDGVLVGGIPRAPARGLTGARDYGK